MLKIVGYIDLLMIAQRAEIKPGQKVLDIATDWRTGCYNSKGGWW
jgi:hypothetical protein